MGKSLMAFVESDRCASDAIHAVTGRSLDKRTVKCPDYEKMAAQILAYQVMPEAELLDFEPVRIGPGG